MIDILVFYAVSVVFQLYNSGMEYHQISSLVFYVVLQHKFHITAGWFFLNKFHAYGFLSLLLLQFSTVNMLDQDLHYTIPGFRFANTEYDIFFCERDCSLNWTNIKFLFSQEWGFLSNVDEFVQCNVANIFC